jgi:hypothetical protein
MSHRIKRGIPIPLPMTTGAGTIQLRLERGHGDVARPLCAAALAAVFGLAAMSRGNAAESRLQGAWLQDGACAETFSRAGKGIAFKKPVNVFAPAFIIAGNRLRTPTASCTIKAVKAMGERSVLSLQCATAVAVEDVRAIIAVSPDGALLRYLNDQDAGGSRYARCSL